eukprot:357754-Chlamydomonas_euryale.AAC.1
MDVRDRGGGMSALRRGSRRLRTCQAQRQRAPERGLFTAARQRGTQRQPGAQRAARRRRRRHALRAGRRRACRRGTQQEAAAAAGATGSGGSGASAELVQLAVQRQLALQQGRTGTRAAAAVCQQRERLHGVGQHSGALCWGDARTGREGTPPPWRSLPSIGLQAQGRRQRRQGCSLQACLRTAETRPPLHTPSTPPIPSGSSHTVNKIHTIHTIRHPPHATWRPHQRVDSTKGGGLPAAFFGGSPTPSALACRGKRSAELACRGKRSAELACRGKRALCSFVG